MEYVKKHIDLYIKIIIIIFFAIIFFNMNKCYMYMDDEVYSKVFYNWDTFKSWAIEFYNIWSGRIITTSLSTIFLRMPLIIFKICNTIIYLIAVMSIYDIIKSNKKIQNIIGLFILFLITFLIDKNVIKMGALWVTGSFNYLWPMAFMYLALIPFIKEIFNVKYSKKYYILYIIANFIGCFAEQSALVLTVSGSFNNTNTYNYRIDGSRKFCEIYSIIIKKVSKFLDVGFRR